MQFTILSALFLASGILAAPQGAPTSDLGPASGTSDSSSCGTSGTTYEKCNNLNGKYTYGCNWTVRGVQKYISVGHSERIDGTLVACGTTDKCNFGAFAKCKTKVGSWDVYPSTPKNLNIACVWKESGEPNQGSNDGVAIA